MKKLITLLLAAIMVLTLIPAMAFSAYADEDEVEVVYPDPSDDFWSVWRDRGDYAVAEGEPYRPAVGYEYTNEGFKTISPVFGNYTVKANITTSRPVDLKDGFYMEVRVDEFAYAGEKKDQDEWLAFSIADKALTGPANDNSDHWCVLLRGAGNGEFHRGDAIGSFKNTAKTDSAPGSFVPLGSFDAETYKNGLTVENGVETYTFEVSYDGSEYTIKVNGAVLAGATGLTDHINSMEQTYVLFTMHSGVVGGKASATITKQGTSAADADVPTGSDSAEPEENLLVYGDLVDASTVPENQPALIMDANKTSIKKDPTGSNISLTPTGSGAYAVKASGDIPYFTWGIKRELTYNAQDFPVIVMMLKNFIGNDGGAYFCSGEVAAATDKYMMGWSQWDDNARFYGADEEYTLVVMDFTEMIAGDEALLGRFHSVRPHFGVDPNDEEMSQWSIEFMANFRSIEEAHAYADAWAEENIVIETGADTDAPVVTDAPIDTDAPADDTDAPADDTEAPVAGDTDAATDAETKAETKAETEAPAAEGCASVIGFGAVAVIAAAAAAVVLKKKD